MKRIILGYIFLDRDSNWLTLGVKSELGDNKKNLASKIRGYVFLPNLPTTTDI